MRVMLRFLLKLLVILPLTFAMLNIITRTVGTTQPPNPALAGFSEGCEGKPQPCWYGIVPGVTTMEEADQILKGTLHFMEVAHDARGSTTYQPSGHAGDCPFIVYSGSDRVSWIDWQAVQNCLPIQLGDIATRFMESGPFKAAPTGMAFERGSIYASVGTTRPGGLCIVELTPFAPITHLNISQPDADTRQKWRGFMAYGLYSKLYDFLDCDITQ